MTRASRAWYILLFFALCLAFGGASNGGFLGNFVLQILAVGLLLLVAISTRERQPARVDRSFWWLLGIFAVVAVAQFIPLPLSLWSSLPGRQEILDDLALVGVVPRPTMVTLSLHETISSLVWILPPIAFAVVLARREELQSRELAAILVGFAFLSIALGVLQFFGGQNSSAYFYEITNRGLMVGFFSNANHMATLLLVALPFLAALLRNEMDRLPNKASELVILGFVLAGLIIVGIALVGSLTGFGLALPVILLSLAIMLPKIRKVTAWMLAPALLLGGIFIASTDEVGNVFAEDATGLQAGRQQIFTTTLEAAIVYWPVGTGAGTFREIYDDFEDLDTATTTYINHAHNDYLEILLEFGAAGGLAIAAFLAWWAWTVVRLAKKGLDDPFVSAAVVGSGVILLHSFWDYPLRTVSIGVVFAFCCVVIARASLMRAEPEDVIENGLGKRDFGR